MVTRPSKEEFLADYVTFINVLYSFSKQKKFISQNKNSSRSPTRT